MAKRQPAGMPAKTTATIAAEAKAEQARKRASKAALKAAKAEVADEDTSSTQAKVDPALEAIAAQAAKTREAENAAAALATAKADAEATGVTFEEMLAEMGIDEHGHPLKLDTRYQGPMLALAGARKSYVKAANGILCNGDLLAVQCGSHTREETVAALIRALKLPGNPYLSLNPGQQSMNLRNKARNALKNGTLTYAEVDAAFAAA